MGLRTHGSWWSSGQEDRGRRGGRQVRIVAGRGGLSTSCGPWGPCSLPYPDPRPHTGDGETKTYCTQIALRFSAELRVLRRWRGSGRIPFSKVPAYLWVHSAILAGDHEVKTLLAFSLLVSVAYPGQIRIRPFGRRNRTASRVYLSIRARRMLPPCCLHYPVRRRPDWAMSLAGACPLRLVPLRFHPSSSYSHRMTSSAELWGRFLRRTLKQCVTCSRNATENLM